MQIDEATYKRMPAHLQALFVKAPNPGSEEVMETFEAFGEKTSGSGKRRPKPWKSRNAYGFSESENGASDYTRDGDTGTAARFFMCAKASKEERNRGLDGVEIITIEALQPSVTGGNLWESVVPKVTLRVDTELSPPRAIVESGACGSAASEWNMLLFGSALTAPYLTEWKSITATATSSTTKSRTLNWLTRSLTSASIPVANCERESGGSPAGTAGRSTPSITITSDQGVSLPGVGPVASGMRLRISGNVASPASHPCVKPLELCRWLVRLVAHPGACVLDPFCGSGSIGVACRQNDIRFVGVELDPAYAETARRRIAEAVPLFDRIIKASTSEAADSTPTLFDSLP